MTNTHRTFESLVRGATQILRDIHTHIFLIFWKIHFFKQPCFAASLHENDLQINTYEMLMRKNLNFPHSSSLLKLNDYILWIETAPNTCKLREKLSQFGTDTNVEQRQRQRM